MPHSYKDVAPAEQQQFSIWLITVNKEAKPDEARATVLK
jgi:hypothetical protein